MSMSNKSLFYALVALLLSLGGAHAQTSGEGIFNPGARTATIPGYTANGGVPNWKAGRAAVEANSADTRVLILGNSSDVGYGSTYDSAGTDALSGGWVNQLALLLRVDYGLNANANSISGNHNIASASYDAFDARVTINDWTSIDSSGYSYAFGGYAWINDDTTAFEFTPTDPGYDNQITPTVDTDTLDVYSYGTSGASWSVSSSTGGSACSLPDPSANTFVKTTCTFPAGNATYSFTGTSDFCCVLGTAVARLSTLHEVSLINGAFSGGTIAEATTATGESKCSGGAGSYCPWDLPAQISVFAPSLCIIGFGGDDAFSQASVTATFNGTTTMDVTAVSSGTIAVGDTVSGATLFTPNMTVTAFGTGSGSTGTYTISATVATASGVAVNIGTPPATFTAGLETLANECQAVNADVLFINSTLAYQSAVNTLATTLNAPVLNNSWQWQAPGSTIPIGASWLVLPGGTWDGEHRGSGGQAINAGILAQILMQ